MPKQSSPPKPNAPAKISKFWEEPPTLHELFDQQPDHVKERLARHDYEHGSNELLSRLLERTGQGYSPELAMYLARIVRGEIHRKKGRPRGSTQDDPLTRFRIYAEIVRWVASGMSLEQAYTQIAKLAGRTPRVIRQYYEEFKNPPSVKPTHTPSSTK